MIVFDDAHLAWWERSKRTVLENLAHDRRVCGCTRTSRRNATACWKADFCDSFGSVALHESGPIREAIFAKLLPREQTHVGAEARHWRTNQDRESNRRPRQTDYLTFRIIPELSQRGLILERREGHDEILRLRYGAEPPPCAHLLAEKGLSVPTVQVDLRNGEQFTPSFRAINPDFTVPALVLDDGTTIADAIAICRYFEEIHPEPSLMGRNPVEKALIESWQRRVERDGFTR